MCRYGHPLHPLVRSGLLAAGVCGKGLLRIVLFSSFVFFVCSYDMKRPFYLGVPYLLIYALMVVLARYNAIIPSCFSFYRKPLARLSIVSCSLTKVSLPNKRLLRYLTACSAAFACDGSSISLLYLTSLHTKSSRFTPRSSPFVLIPFIFALHSSHLRCSVYRSSCPPYCRHHALMPLAHA